MVFRSTQERKSMSKKTFFKRIALGVIAALGLSFMVSPSAQAVRLTNSVTLSSATASTTVGDSASVTVTLRQTATQNATDSMTIRVSCDAPTGQTCPALSGYQDALADTSNVIVQGGRTGVWIDLSGWGDSQSVASSSMRSVISAKGTSFPAAGTYTYTIYATGNGGASDVITGTSTTWTVTVTAVSSNAASGSADVYISADTETAMNARLAFRSPTDSAIVATRGTAAEPRLTGYAFVVLKNAAGETRVAQGNGFIPVQDSVTVSVSGPGLVRAGGMGSGATKATTINVWNQGNNFYATETLAIYADGTAGTMTITFSKGVTTLATKTVTFFGTPASAVTNLSDTYTALGTAGTTSVTLSGQVKDSGGNALASGQVYVFSSDTKIAGNVPTSAVFGQTSHACNSYLGSSASTYRLNCPIILRDTGVVTLTVGDSWTIAGSSWTSTAIELTITGNIVSSATVSFDKATYAPGERAVITITTKDLAGRLLAQGASGTHGAAPISNYTLTGVTTAGIRGTAGASDNTYSTTITNYLDTGIETRVVTMPSFGADVSYTIYAPNHPASLGTNTAVTATAKVVDPNATAIATAQAAADAATDAALEAIDAANAATDAANLAAEAADAATVAAEEARDAADAATAAVEALATEVATLMAALKAQITTLARTVAKIAKKVKA
jgi:hypothetical protein